MIDHGRVRNTILPGMIVIDEYSVWENSNITEIQVTIDGETHIEYEYNQAQYTKDEYYKLQIAALEQANAELKNALEALLRGDTE